MKRPTLKAFLKSRKLLVVMIPLGVFLIIWVSWITGLIVLGMTIAFGYSHWQGARVCCACAQEIPYGSRYCLACGAKFKGGNKP